MSIKFEYDKEEFIWGENLDVPLIGNVRFLTYREYIGNIVSLSLINMKSLHIYYAYKDQFSKDPTSKNNQELHSALKDLKKQRLYSIVFNQPEFKEAYKKIFLLVLDQNDEEHIANVVDLIFSEEEVFMFMRQLVLDMQMLVEEEVAEDEKVQSYLEKSKRVKRRDGSKQTLFDITSSIVVGTKYSYRDIANMTVIQVYATYYRLGLFKAYDTSTLFASVSGETKHIEQWNKNIDLFETQSSGIKASEFNKNFGGLFK